MKKLKLLAMSLAAIMTVSTVGMGDYAAVKGDDTTTCEVSTFSGNECVTYGKQLLRIWEYLVEAYLTL